MSAEPKRRRPSRRKGFSLDVLKRKMAKKLPNLVKLPGGKQVPSHTVTPDNPEYKGTKFLRAKKKKK